MTDQSPDLDVRDFHRKFGHPAPSAPVVPSDDVLDFRVRLIREECEELIEAIEERNLGSIAQEGVDLVYVVLGTFVVCGLRFTPFWRLVQRANMAKIPNPDGGKPLKPEGWIKPDCSTLIDPWPMDRLCDD